MNFGLVSLTNRLSCNFDVDSHFLRPEAKINMHTRIFAAADASSVRILKVTTKVSIQTAFNERFCEKWFCLIYIGG
jgi:hypothetical protein